MPVGRPAGSQLAEPFLVSITDLAATVVPGVLAASVTVVSEQAPMTPGFTGRLAWELDQQQYQLGGGPCMAAAVEGEDVDVVDARTDPRWPAYAAAATGRGSLSSLSVSLTTAGGPLAALNLYAGEAGAFSDIRTRRVAVRVARSAAAGLGALRGAERATARAEGLQRAMDSRATIDCSTACWRCSSAAASRSGVTEAVLRNQITPAATQPSTASNSSTRMNRRARKRCVSARSRPANGPAPTTGAAGGVWTALMPGPPSVPGTRSPGLLPPGSAPPGSGRAGRAPG